MGLLVSYSLDALTFVDGLWGRPDGLLWSHSHALRQMGEIIPSTLWLAVVIKAPRSLRS